MQLYKTVMDNVACDGNWRDYTYKVTPPETYTDKILLIKIDASAIETPSNTSIIFASGIYPYWNGDGAKTFYMDRSVNNEIQFYGSRNNVYWSTNKIVLDWSEEVTIMFSCEYPDHIGFWVNGSKMTIDDPYNVWDLWCQDYAEFADSGQTVWTGTGLGSPVGVVYDVTVQYMSEEDWPTYVTSVEIESGFWNAIDGDRRYTAYNMNSFFGGFVGEGYIPYGADFEIDRVEIVDDSTAKAVFTGGTIATPFGGVLKYDDLEFECLNKWNLKRTEVLGIKMEIGLEEEYTHATLYHDYMPYGEDIPTKTWIEEEKAWLFILGYFVVEANTAITSNDWTSLLDNKLFFGKSIPLNNPQKNIVTSFNLYEGPYEATPTIPPPWIAPDPARIYRNNTFTVSTTWKPGTAATALDHMYGEVIQTGFTNVKCFTITFGSNSTTQSPYRYRNGAANSEQSLARQYTYAKGSFSNKPYHGRLRITKLEPIHEGKELYYAEGWLPGFDLTPNDVPYAIGKEREPMMEIRFFYEYEPVTAQQYLWPLGWKPVAYDNRSIDISDDPTLTRVIWYDNVLIPSDGQMATQRTGLGFGVMSEATAVATVSTNRYATNKNGYYLYGNRWMWDGTFKIFMPRWDDTGAMYFTRMYKSTALPALAWQFDLNMGITPEF